MLLEESSNDNGIAYFCANEFTKLTTALAVDHLHITMCDNFHSIILLFILFQQIEFL